MEDLKNEMRKMEKKNRLNWLDTVVAEFNLNKHICSKPSKHCQPSQRREYSMSEHMMHSHCTFIFNGMAAKIDGLTLENDFRFMSPNDMKEYYEEHQMYNNDPKNIMENVMLTHFHSEKEMEVVMYRWNNNMAFCNYSERVAIALETRRTTDELSIEELGRDLIRAIEIQKVLRDELPIVNEKDISLSTRRVLQRTRYDWRTILKVAQEEQELKKKESKDDTVIVDDEERETFE